MASGTRVVRSLLFASGLVALGGCAGGCSAESGGTEQARVASYNVGLARDFVPRVEPRLELLEERLPEMSADLLCLQEVWTEGDRQALEEAAAEAYPHRHVHVTEESGGSEPACTEDELQPLRDCVESNCADVEGSELTSCAVNQCGGPLGEVSGGCRDCLVSRVGQPLDEIFESCTTGGGSLTWGGHNGLMVLSRSELTTTGHTKLTSTTVQRSALHVRTELPSVGPADVYCTHLAATLSQVDYNGPFDSWADENRGQAEELRDWIDETSGSGPTLVLGDLNSGPARSEAGIEAAIPEASYGVLTGAGFRSWAVAEGEPACTFCADNALLPDDAPDELIDHVLVGGDGLSAPRGGEAAVRLGTELATVDTGDGEVELHPSDHYGVEARLTGSGR